MQDFCASADAIEPELEKLHGLQYVRVQVPSEQPLCKLIDTDGNQIVAAKLTSDGTISTHWEAVGEHDTTL